MYASVWVYLCIYYLKENMYLIYYEEEYLHAFMCGGCILCQFNHDFKGSVNTILFANYCYIYVLPLSFRWIILEVFQNMYQRTLRLACIQLLSFLLRKCMLALHEHIYIISISWYVHYWAGYVTRNIMSHVKSTIDFLYINIKLWK